MNLLKLKRNVAKYYRTQIKGNENDDLLTIRKKLTRNVLLSRKAEPSRNDNKKLYFYGNLQILVVNNKVVWLKNGDKKLSWIDYKRKHELNELLKIS